MGRRPASTGGAVTQAAFIDTNIFIDTNTLVRHLTGDPPALAERATRYLAGADTLLTDMIVAELVRIANATREIVAEERQRYIAARWESTGVPRTAE